MVRFRVQDRLAGLMMVGVVVVAAGCPGTGPTGSGGSPGSGGTKSGDDPASKIGEYMPPLDGGKLEIAAPKGWDWANPGGDVLVAFKPKDAELNALPRVLLSVADSEFPGIDDVTPDNVDTFVRLVADSLADQKPKESARSLAVGKHHFARYMLLGKRRNQVVVQQFLTTVAGGRVYTLRLEVNQPQYDKYKTFLSVIAASMKFAGEAAAPSAEPEKPAAEAPAEEPSLEEKPAPSPEGAAAEKEPAAEAKSKE